MHRSSIRSAVITAERNKSSKHSLLSSGYQCNSFSCFALMSVIRTFFSLAECVYIYIYVKQIFDHFFNKIIMENMTKEIAELLQQIRQVENEHNELVDEYFQMSM